MEITRQHFFIRLSFEYDPNNHGQQSKVLAFQIENAIREYLYGFNALGISVEELPTNICQVKVIG